MSIPAGFPYPLKQEVEIPLEQIIPNPDQPRKLEDKEAIQLLAASMKAKGQEVAARVRPLTEAERAAHPGVWVMLIGGHGRREAAILNQFRTLKCTVEDIAPEEAFGIAARDNAIRGMHWWEWYLIIEGVDKASHKSQREIADELGQTQTKVNWALKITKTLNPAARALVLENLQKTLKKDDWTPITKNKDFSITEQTLLVLAGLEDPAQVLPALQEVLDNYLTTGQAQKLVEHMQAGYPAETFNKKTSGNQTPAVQSSTGSHPTVHHVSHPTHLSPTGVLALSAASPSPAGISHLSPSGDTANAVGDPLTKTGGSAPSEPKDTEPGWFDKWLVGIKFITELRKKVKQGEALTKSELMLVGLYKLYELALKPIGKRIGGFAKWVGKGIWDSLKKAFGKVLGKTVEVVLPWVIVIGLVWGILAFFHFAVISPLHWVEHKIVSIFHHEDIAPISTPAPAPDSTSLAIPTAPPSVRSSQLKTANSKPKTHHSPPVAVYQPAVSFIPDPSSVKTLYDPKILEQEIAAIPRNSVIKDYIYQPDEGMPADLAVSRLQDLTDPDKYTMMIGNSKQKILSFTPSNTNFILTYKSTDPFSLLGGGSGLMNFFWEDVLYIHTDEIDVADKNHSVIYQCSLVVKDTKNPLTIQCASADDLENLVSTLEYFIRHSRLGHDAQPGGMPYPLQGLVLNGDCAVQKLWADSPMGKAGLKLGDMVWSLDINTPEQQDQKNLEAALRALAPGPHTLYMVNPADLTQAQRDVTLGRAKTLSPKRYKVLLSI